MGPTQDHLGQVKRDAMNATLKHFRNDMEDNHFEPVVPLDEVRTQLAGIGDPWSESSPVVVAEAPVDEPVKRKRKTKAEAPVDEPPVDEQPEGAE